MTESATSAVDVWKAFSSLSANSRDQFIELMLADPAVREEVEDLLDLELADQRSREPVRPLEEVLAELER
jgi:hypothetical protein